MSGRRTGGRSQPLLGELAMEELMSNPDVEASLGTLERYIDPERMAKALFGN